MKLSTSADTKSVLIHSTHTTAVNGPESQVLSDPAARRGEACLQRQQEAVIEAAPNARDFNFELAQKATNRSESVARADLENRFSHTK